MINNLTFKGTLQVNQQNYDHIQDDLKMGLKKSVESMPDGDRFEVTIEPTGYQLRTKYFPGNNAPNGAEKIHCIQKNDEDVFTLADELSSSLKDPKFDIKDFLKDTKLLIGNSFNRMFVDRRGEVDFKSDKDTDSYVFRKTGEEVIIFPNKKV